MPDEMAEAAGRDYKRKLVCEDAARALKALQDSGLITPGEFNIAVKVEGVRAYCAEEAERLVRAWN